MGSIYRKVIFNEEGTRLRGRILVGDAGDYGKLHQLAVKGGSSLRTWPCSSCPPWPAARWRSRSCPPTPQHRSVPATTLCHGTSLQGRCCLPVADQRPCHPRSLRPASPPTRPRHPPYYYLPWPPHRSSLFSSRCLPVSGGPFEAPITHSPSGVLLPSTRGTQII